MALPGSEERPFVGRQDELKQFDKVLASPKGQAVIVTGQAGMGKTMLVNRMAKCAKDHPELKCGAVRYDVTPTEPVAETMALMMDHVYEAAQVGQGFLSGTQEQWRAFLNVFNIGDLAMSLRRDPQRNTRDQFIERLKLIFERLPDNGRAIFIVDPEKYMQSASQDDWRLVVRDLPDKIKFIFAQRPEDVLLSSADFMSLPNVARIPGEQLDVLNEQDVEELLMIRQMDLKGAIGETRDAIARYNGHPYAVQAALDLIADGRAIEDLPADPTKEEIARTQWDQVCDKHEKAVDLLHAYAILDVAVPDDVVEAVSGTRSAVRRTLLPSAYLSALLRKESDGRRIYHTLLADHIRDQLSDKEAKAYHRCAVAIYRKRLTAEVKPDALAAQRLPEHVLVVDGPQAFVDSFISECGQSLINLGFLDTFVSLSHRALSEFVKPGIVDEASLLGNLGIVYETRGDLDQAETMYKKSLYISESLGLLNLTANQYGNLGLIYKTRGDLDKAEKMHRKSLEINEKLGRLEGMARQYGNLGNIYSTRGDLDQAEKMHRKSLEINEKLGRLEGMAGAYGNLGNIYSTRGDLDQAEQMYKKSLDICEALGLLKLTANQYGNLGNIYLARGDLDKAEEMYRKSLEINEKLGRLEGMASAYANLGSVYEQRGDIAAARDSSTKSRDLFEQIGMRHMVEKLQGWLDELPPDPT